ncbi:MAG: hypothetical protein ACI9KE_000619 [Polyangiales bacterium]|jgi:hypothetical protein
MLLRSRLLVLLAFALAACSSDPPETQAPETTVEVLRPPVLAPRASVPETEEAVERVLVESDALTFVYRSAAEAGTPREGDVVAGRTDGGYLRRITSCVEVSPTRIRCETEVAQLTDLFEDVHFRVSFEPRTQSWTQTINGDGVGSRTDMLGGSIEAIPDIQLSEHCTLPSGTNIEVTADFQPRFDTEVDIFRRRSRHLRIELGGVISVGATATMSNGVTVVCEFEIPAEDLPEAEFTNWFFVGWVPVAITHTIGAKVGIETTAGLDAGTFEATASAELSFDVYLDYLQDRGWDADGDAARSASASASTNQELTGRIGITVKPALLYLMKIYDSVGPEIGVVPEIEAEVSATLCEWEAHVNGALNVSLAPKVDVPVFDINILEVDFNLNLIESTQLWSGEGTFSWCRDAGGMPDGGMGPDAGPGRDSGPVISTPDSGPGADAGPGDGDSGPATDVGPGGDPCGMEADCAECTTTPGCGWGADGCITASPGATGVATRAAECYDCTGLSTCTPCAEDGFCDWCPGSGCHNTYENACASPTPVLMCS